MVIQSAGTGLALASGIFLVVFAAVAGDAAGAGVAVGVVVAGFCAQPARSAAALNSNKILFIDPPEIF
jgi:hypothetical protein